MHSGLIVFRRSLWLCVVAGGIANLAGAAQQLQVHLERSADKTTPVEVRAVDGDGAEVTAVGTAPGLVEIQVEPSRIWTFEAEGDGVWAPPRTMFVGPDDRHLRLDVFEASPISGVLIAPKGEAIPSVVVLTASPALDGEARGVPSLWERRCSTDPDGRFECQLPVGDVDLKLRAATYLSYFRWGLEIGPDGFDWESVRLVPGASVVVSVVNREGDPLPKATIDVSRPATVTQEGYSSPRSRHTITNDRGVAVFESLDPGVWIVRASQEGMAQSVSPPIRVLSRTEVSLRDPLVLDEPTILSVVVSPAATPWNEPWLVGIQDAGQSASGSELVQAKPTDPGGWVQWGSVPRRRVVLSVTDGYGGIWNTKEFDLTTEAQPIQVRLDVIPVGGRIKEPAPVSGTLVWRTRPGDGSVRQVTAAIEPDGAYSVALPRDGEWLVAIRGADGGLSETVAVKIERPDKDQSRILDLRFPTTQVSGRVIDHKGRPVARAQVSVAPITAAELEKTVAVATTLTDQDGEFAIRAHPGEVLLTAMGPDGGSATMNIVFGPGVQKTAELRLSEPGVLRGRIFQEGQPTPGVTIITLPISAGPARLEPQQSDASGRFEARLSSPAPVTLVAIPPRGGAVIQVASPGGDEVLVNLPAVSGRVEVRWDVAPGVRPFLRLGAAVVGLDFLVMFSPAHGGLSESGRIVVPNLACGRYELCLPPAQGESAAPACRPIDVLPGGHTVVDMTVAD